MPGDGVTPGINFWPEIQGPIALKNNIQKILIFPDMIAHTTGDIPGRYWRWWWCEKLEKQPCIYLVPGIESTAVLLLYVGTQIRCDKWSDTWGRFFEASGDRVATAVTTLPGTNGRSPRFPIGASVHAFTLVNPFRNPVPFWGQTTYN